MCGINGIYGLSDSFKPEETMVRMNHALAHRGPDDEGIFSEGNITLGHRRLSIIDLSSAGHQPMISSDNRYSIVYNGELYNYKEIKNQLKDYNFHTDTDTEVILAAYQKWGNNSLQHFNGMYAFAIWDREKKELFIARDRLGIKPLYFFRKENMLVFSSEVRALLASNLIPRKIDKDSLIDYLRYQTVHAPKTILKDVSMLLPGHYLIVSQNEFTCKKYWDITDNIDESIAKKSYTEVCKDVHSLLHDAVERRLIADVPFGAFLSGGIDSSAIVGMMSNISKEKVKTFSVVFDDEEFSEAKYARLVAGKFATEHHEIKLNISDFISELPNALKAMDHPSGDGPNTYVVSKATKNAGITMALSGLGGDELFAGYDIFKRTLDLQNKNWLNTIPQFIREAAGSILSTAKPGIASEKIAELLKQGKINFNSLYPLSRQVLMDKQILSIVNRQVLPKNRVAEIIRDCQLRTENSELSKVSVAEISTYMQNVLLRDTDQMSMAHALEVRVPFLDYQLVEYLIAVPDKYKNPITPKKLLVDALGDLIPSEVINRPKMGFTFPWKHWLKNELRVFCEQKLTSLSERDSFNKKEVLNLWNEFLNGNPRITWSRIWYLVVLENWLIENKIDE